MQRKEIISIIGLLLLLIVIGIGVFFLKWWNLTELTSAVLIVLVSGIVGFIVFGFRHRFETPKETPPKPELKVEYDEENAKQYSPYVDAHRVLRIRVRNIGDEIAEECEARLEAFDYDGNRLTEEKYLQWTKFNDTKANIPPHDSVFLCIVFSTKNAIDEHIAFASTHQSSDFSISPRLKDGFRVGNYKLIIRIKPTNLNEALYVKFNLGVKESWEEISMSKTEERLSSE